MRTASNPAPALEQTPRRPCSFPVLFLGCLAALLILTILAIGVGRYAISPATVVRVLLSRFLPIPATWEGQAESVIFTLRLPRILAALLVGSALSLSGAAYQGVFKNPLVAPDMLGVSAGACVGASVGILMNAGGVGIQAGALLGGLAAVLLAIAIPKVIKNQSMMTLVLAGVIISGLMNAILGLLKYLADPETQLASITHWQLGSLASYIDYCSCARTNIVDTQRVTGQLPDLILCPIIGLASVSGCHGACHICLRKTAFFHYIFQRLADSVCSDSSDHNGGCHNFTSILQDHCLGCSRANLNSQCIHN